jgi:hypothetical protein
MEINIKASAITQYVKRRLLTEACDCPQLCLPLKGKAKVLKSARSKCSYSSIAVILRRVPSSRTSDNAAIFGGLAMVFSSGCLPSDLVAAELSSRSSHRAS